MSMDYGRLARFTGIDVSTPAAVYFGYLLDGADELPDWEVEPIVSSRHIPGSYTTIVQYHGMGPATVTYRLELDSVEEYRKLVARIMTMVTLTTLGNHASVRGRIEYRLGHVYEHLDNTLLAGIRNVTFAVDGFVEADVTFQRAFNPATGGAVTP